MLTFLASSSIDILGTSGHSSGTNVKPPSFLRSKTNPAIRFPSLLHLTVGAATHFQPSCSHFATSTPQEHAKIASVQTLGF